MSTTVQKNAAGTWDTLTDGTEAHTFKTRTAAREFAARRDAEASDLDARAADIAAQHEIVTRGRAAKRDAADRAAEAEAGAYMVATGSTGATVRHERREADGSLTVTAEATVTRPENGRQKRAQTFSCTFPECVHHSK